jgi:hypothetical protein
MSDTHNDGQISFCQGFANFGAVLSVLALGGSGIGAYFVHGAKPVVSYVVFGAIAVAILAAPTVIERVTGRGR